MRWFDLRSLESAALQPVHDVDLRLHVFSTYLEALEPDQYDIDLEEFPRIDADQISQLLLDALGDTWNDPSLFLEADGGFLRAEGNAKSLAAIEELLRTLTQGLLQTVHVELMLLPAGSVPAATPPLLSAKAAAELIAANPGRLIAAQHSPLGQRLMLGNESLRSTLYDYDVEVAQFAQVGDPSVSIQRAGTRFGAVVRACPDGQLFVRAWGRHGVPDEDLATTELPGLGGAIIQLPSGRSNVVLSSATLANGGAMLLGQTGSDSKLWLLRVTRDGPLPSGAGTWLPMGELTSPGIMHDSPGRICVAGQIYRLNNPIFVFDPAGEAGFCGAGSQIPTNGSRPGIPAMAVGSTWYFQVWYRDSQTSNFSDSWGVTF